MKKIAEYICNKKNIIIIICSILLVLSFIGMKLTKVNYDILVYLPSDIETIRGQNTLTNDFDMGSYSIAVAKNLNAKEILDLEDKIKKIDGVNEVLSLYDVIGTSIPVEMLPSDIVKRVNNNEENLLFITFKGSTSSEETLNAVKEIRNISDGKIVQGGMSSMILDTKELSEKEIIAYIIIAVLLCIVVLELSLDSYVVPFILLTNIGSAILFNLGTNVFLGQISYITKALVAVLQLGVTTDFSIFLYHSYEKKKEKYSDKKKAMVEAICDTFTSVTGSSLTTIAGFLVLCTMMLTLGKDLGIVMAKGVLLGVITVLTLFPSLILAFDKLIDKTKHKNIIPVFSHLNKFLIKHHIIIFIIFIICLIPSYLAYSKVDVYYKLDKSLPATLESINTNEKIKNDYNIVSMEVVLVDKNLKNDQVKALTEELQNVEGIDFVASYAKLKDMGITENMLKKDIVNVFENDKYQMIVFNSVYDIATDELNNQVTVVNNIVKKYDENAIVAGEGPLMKDLVSISDTDFKNVNTSSIICIFIILFFVLKSFTLPVFLISAIEFAIFANMGVSYFGGTVLPFVAPIVLGTIQLGATIDYAILLTTTYIKHRRDGKEKNEAMLETLNYSGTSILISGMCFFAATFGVGLYSKIEMIGSICSLISRGAIISMMVVIMVLPSILLIFDKLILKTTFKGGNIMKVFKKKGKNVLATALVLGVLFSSIPVNTYALTKKETVYSKLNFDGTVKNVIVNEQLVNDKNENVISDYSYLKDILNLSNDSTYTITDNKITWKANGKDILYQGTSTKKLPVNEKITYYLDGKESSLEDIIGKKGNVKIKIHYSNNDAHYVNGKTLYTPFVVTMGMIIDDNISNLEITNGKSVSTGTKNAIVGIATPGLYESLGISSLKGLDEITISYDTNKFELGSIYSVVSSKLIDSNDLSVFNKLDSVFSKVDTLTDGMNKIEDGAKVLSEGTKELKDNYYLFHNGLGNVNNGMYELNSGVKELSNGVSNITNNQYVIAIRKYLPEIANDIDDINTVSSKYVEEINEYIKNNKELSNEFNAYLVDANKYTTMAKDYANKSLGLANDFNDYTKTSEQLVGEVSKHMTLMKGYTTDLNSASKYMSDSAGYIIKLYKTNPDLVPEDLYKEALALTQNNLVKKLGDYEQKIATEETKIAQIGAKLNSITTNVKTISSTINPDDIKYVEMKINDIGLCIKNMQTDTNLDVKTIDTKLVKNKINSINTNIDNLENGVNLISEGTSKLSTGVNTLYEKSEAIYDGISKLSDGSNALYEGIVKYNNEGIKKLANVINTDVKGASSTMKELVKLGDNYNSYAGSNTKNGETKFILVVDGKKVEEKEEIKVETNNKVGFWQRVKNLFS